jgi:hypothetical protein
VSNNTDDTKYGWRVVLLATITILVTYGNPDIIDGLIHMMMK